MKETDTNDGVEILDAAVTKILTAFGQRGPRRRFLEKLGKYMLTVLGIGIIELLPIDRAYGQTCNCNDPIYCGMMGQYCTACPGGTCQECPTGSETTTANWMKCCGGHCYTYTDCCFATPPACCNQGGSCHSEGGQAWCNEGTSYCCTVSVRGAPCVSTCNE
jgi:hypothetical protein